MLNRHKMQYNDKGHLLFGGIDTIQLSKKYGTPLFVYDVEKIRKNAQSFKEAFRELGIKGKIAYASKAFSSIAIAEIMAEEGLYLDVVSKGEMYTALAANFPPENIHFHGNNKSYEELEMAINNNLGCIVVDNFHELKLIEGILNQTKKEINVMLRVTPGVNVDTHKYIVTGSEDSKFGFYMRDDQIDKVFHYILNSPKIHLLGLHFHIGSQLFEVKQYLDSLTIVMDKIAIWHKETGYIPSVINIGGGFGIQYTSEDHPKKPKYYLENIFRKLKDQASEIGIPLPELWIEPGRSIVGDTCITLYEIGSIKNIPGVRKYVSVDGGMTDNIRPALYDSKYEGIIANKANESPTEEVAIAGKCCESGDMLIHNLPVPKVEPGDILALFSTGAYGYSMANHYNRFPKPAVVFIENKKDVLVIKRETYKDTVKNDLSYKGIK